MYNGVGFLIDAEGVTEEFIAIIDRLLSKYSIQNASQKCGAFCMGINNILLFAI